MLSSFSVTTQLGLAIVQVRYKYRRIQPLLAINASDDTHSNCVMLAKLCFGAIWHPVLRYNNSILIATLFSLLCLSGVIKKRAIIDSISENCVHRTSAHVCARSETSVLKRKFYLFAHHIFSFNLLRWKSIKYPKLNSNVAETIQLHSGVLLKQSYSYCA